MCILSFKRPQARRSQRPKPDWLSPSGYPIFPAPEGTDSAAGAVALRLMICNGYGVERYRPPRRTGCGGIEIAQRLPGAGPSASAGLDEACL
ncbi:hypothetical protein, partial [Hyphomonas atlantica]|uniref:hypothetical protein n=1 Tax=Hyphomonas atlantica TaxID=1280948 RepID=UPI003519BD1F